MTDKSTDTLEQIIDHALTKGVTIGRITVDEILDIAIKSPEAEKHWRQQVGRELLDPNIRTYGYTAELVNRIFEVCQMEVQSE